MTLVVGFPDGSTTKYRRLRSWRLDHGDLVLTLADGRAVLLAGGQWTYASEPRSIERSPAREEVLFRG